MTVLATHVEDGIDLFVHDIEGHIKIKINGSYVNATNTTIDQWSNMTFEQKEALVNYYISIFRSY